MTSGVVVLKGPVHGPGGRARIAARWSQSRRALILTQVLPWSISRVAVRFLSSPPIMRSSAFIHVPSSQKFVRTAGCSFDIVTRPICRIAELLHVSFFHLALHPSKTDVLHQQFVYRNIDVHFKPPFRSYRMPSRSTAWDYDGQQVYIIYIYILILNFQDIVQR